MSQKHYSQEHKTRANIANGSNQCKNGDTNYHYREKIKPEIKPLHTTKKTKDLVMEAIANEPIKHKCNCDQRVTECNWAIASALTTFLLGLASIILCVYMINEFDTEYLQYTLIASTPLTVHALGKAFKYVIIRSRFKHLSKSNQNFQEKLYDEEVKRLNFSLETGYRIWKYSPTFSE